MGLFNEDKPKASASSQNPMNTRPLAHRARPLIKEQLVGQDSALLKIQQICGKDSTLKSLILWGPPGSGKTTLAHILASTFKLELFAFNAVLSGLPELRKLISRALELSSKSGQRTIIFIDEIHRFNKSQQDALLPYVENGDFILIGATTEAPRVSVNRALLSRLHTVELGKLTAEGLGDILTNCNNKFKLNISSECLSTISNNSSGDARVALNLLEGVASHGETDVQKQMDLTRKLISESSRFYDKASDRHYDIISAFIKSMRGSDPDAALLYLAIMIDGGEDPVFIARRLVIFASEDVGNADPKALSLAVSTMQAVQNIGMPEARICLSQTTIYMACTVKSNASYKAIDSALEFVRERETIEVPPYLRSTPPQNLKTPYIYPHDLPEGISAQKMTSIKCPTFYTPGDQGIEKNLKNRLLRLRELKSKL